MGSRNPRSRSSRRGATLVMLAVVIPVLLGVAALAIDVGCMFAMKAETQNAVDAAALAGVSALGTHGGASAARHRAEDYLGPNFQSRTASPNTLEIEVGRWSETAKNFTANHPKPNAVRVVATRNDAPLYFARILGWQNYNVTCEGIAMIDRSVPCKIWSMKDMKLHGGRTDSYDSSAGPYDPAHAGNNGHICSCQKMGLKDETVMGDALYGKKFKKDHGTTVAGTIGKLPECIHPPLDFGNVATVNDNSTIPHTANGHNALAHPYDLKIDDGDSLTLGAGTYYFTKIDMDPGSSLILSGTVNIYVAGNVKMHGSAINTHQDPWEATIYSSGKVEWKGQSTFYGAIIAPEDGVKLHDGELYGALVGRKVDLKNADIHVDESLPFGLFQNALPALVK